MGQCFIYSWGEILPFFNKEIEKKFVFLVYILLILLFYGEIPPKSQYQILKKKPPCFPKKEPAGKRAGWWVHGPLTDGSQKITRTSFDP